MKRRSTLPLLATALAVSIVTYGGHELPIYPSYYPQEIQIEQVDPQSAARLLTDAKIHAYIGKEPIFATAIPESIRYEESLGSILVLTVNPSSPLINDQNSDCNIISTAMRALADADERFMFHPYPVTPLHGDYLHHFDLVGAIKKRYRDTTTLTPDAASSLSVKAKGEIAGRFVTSRWPAETSEWDLTLEQLDVADLVERHVFNLNGWLGPSWVKLGWFQAYVLLAHALDNTSVKQLANSYVQRIRNGDFESVEQRINLERQLVSLLTRNCQRVVLGYTLKREYYNADYSNGIENIAFDSHTGFNSPIFIRTVKLKDFPWNGWLRLGVNGKPVAAWNPIAGFTDGAGRLIWFVAGDPALFPEPYGGSWVLNRIGDVQSTLTERETHRRPQ
jgi:hypothetical protein